MTHTQQPIRFVATILLLMSCGEGSDEGSGTSEEAGTSEFRIERRCAPSECFSICSSSKCQETCPDDDACEEYEFTVRLPQERDEAIYQACSALHGIGAAALTRTATATPLPALSAPRP
ncbi:MAG: hypothetical protein JRH20_27395 [Deltaproteobacteria bacterium]|nr:hypothetical protein [Deltaproteobacteria bacterium]